MKITQLLSELKFVLLAVAWTVLITVLSLISFERTPSFMLQLPFKDKLVHFIFYFVFVVLWCFGLHKTDKIKILLIAVVYGIIIEILQYVLTENRTADFYDVLANSSGAFLAFFVFPIIKKIFLRQK
ncbi:VanZ family protein [Flavobacterium sp. N2270]|uniref:VanZ family protein n=1 Tax=Flavobacterium sp. N2270 TaxID=2986831 RepID=UPI002224D65A|nr:VanZ family protein [Flavobacterium sp. N2270]